MPNTGAMHFLIFAYAHLIVRSKHIHLPRAITLYNVVNCTVTPDLRFPTLDPDKGVNQLTAMVMAAI